MAERIRSRAFELEILRHLTGPFEHVKRWVVCNAEVWAIATMFDRDLPAIVFYIRFKSAKDIRTIQKIHDALKVYPTIKSFKQIKDVYRTGNKVEYSDTEMTKSLVKWKDWQSNVLKYMNSNVDMGMITWVYHGYKTKEFMDLIRHMASLDSVLMSSDDNEDIINIIKTNIIHEKQKIDALIIDLPHSRQLRMDLLDFLDHLRMGLMRNTNGKPYMFTPINIIVFSNHLPDMIAKKRYNLNMMSINNIEDI